jgi:dihydroxy-acid dehydratase
MGAARLDIPTIMMVCGYQPSGTYKNHHMDIEEVFLGAGHHVAGKITLQELKEMSDNAITGPGVCSGMGTANSMHIVTEALGMSLPGGAPILANSDKMFDFARKSGERIVQMVEEDLRPRQIMTRDAFINAAMAILAVSGSINCIKHLQATAIEAKTDIDVYQIFEDLADTIPVLSAVRPIGDTSIEAFEEAGGTLTLMKQLEQFIRKDALTVTGKTAGENLRDVKVAEHDAIRPVDQALATKPAIVIVRGSLASGGGIVKLGLRTGKKLNFEGTAICFSTADSAVNAVKDGTVKPGHVVILRGLGVMGGPGMGMASRVVFAIDGMNLGPEVAFVTDGQLSGLVNKGLVIGEVNPEAAVGGALGLVENGDHITIDIEARTANLDVPESVLAERRAKFKAPEHKDEGWVSIYRRSAQPLSKGAALIDPR